MKYCSLVLVRTVVVTMPKVVFDALERQLPRHSGSLARHLSGKVNPLRGDCVDVVSQPSKHAWRPETVSKACPN